MFFDDALFAATFIDALTSILAFFLNAWGALFVLWGGVKAIRRVFWVEAEPWKGPQTPALEDIRRRFGQRIVLGLEFFLAGGILRLLVDPSLPELARVGTLTLIWVVVSVVVTRELRLPMTGEARPQRKKIAG